MKTNPLGDGATDIAVLGVGPYQLPTEPDGATFAWKLASRVVAWKVFTNFAPIANEGFFLHEGDPPRMVTKALELGVPIITVAKGNGRKARTKRAIRR